MIIPNDGILISSSMLMPRRWFTLALCVAIGSTLGSVLLATFVETRGLEWILEIYPRVNETMSWVWTKNFFEKYGMILVFAVAVTPFIQQPVIIMASLAETPLILLASIIFLGRIIKFLIMAYVGSHAPQYLNKLWGIKNELNETGVDIK
jgi:membrane protein YqaA with SNARE-associated domain